jgi:hypothetical protein
VKPIEWREESRDFWRSECGRFDVFPDASRRGQFVAVDWECGVKRKGFTDIERAKVWCQLVAKRATEMAR